MTDASDEVIALEKLLWERSNDPAAYEQVMAPDAISVIEPLGVVERDTAVAMAPKGRPFVHYAMHDLTVRHPTPDCIVLAYHAEATHEDGKPYLGSICSAYVRRDGRWMMALTAHQPWSPRR